MSSEKHSFFDLIVYWCCLAFAGLLKATPLKYAYAFSRFIFRSVYYIDPVHRNRTVKNLLYAGVAKDIKEARIIAKKNYDQHAKVFVEIFKMHQLLDRENISSHIQVVHSETTRRLVAEGAQMILVTAHFGNWEIAGVCYTFLSGRELLSVKKTMKNPLLGDMIFREREKYNHQGCDKKGAILNLMRALKKGKSVALLVDQHASTSEGVEVLFFGKPARTHASPALLHLKTGVPIIVSVTKRVDDDFHFEFIANDPIIYKPTDNMEEDIKNLTQLYTTQLEDLIRIAPEQWLWAHRRWLNLDRGGSKKRRKKKKHENTENN